MNHRRSILFAGLVLAAAITTARAQFTYVTNSGAITITGYTGSGGSVVIPSSTNGLPVTSIGTNAFADSPATLSYLISSVMIPGSMTNIGDYAFYDDSDLQMVSISPGLISIGGNAFSQCGELMHFTFPSTLTTIEDMAFDGDFNLFLLGSMSIPNGVTHIGSEAFGGAGFSAVSLPASVTNFGINPFDDCLNLTAITVATNNPAYTNINGILFDINQTTLICYPAVHSGASYTVSNTVTTIGPTAFEGCVGLSNILIPSTVTNIGASAFFGCSLTNIMIPASVETIGDTPFGNCYRLTAINVDTNNTAYTSPGGVLFDYAQTTLIAYPAANGSKAYVIPGSVTNIADYAFSYNSGLGSITIPGSVLSIGNNAFEGTYGGSSSLTNVTIANGVTTFGYYAFFNCGQLESVTLPESLLSVGNAAFANCYRLGSITIPASITNFGSSIFANCTGLTNVMIEDGLTVIPTAFFENCDRLGRTTIPASVTNIEPGAFFLDSKLAGVYFEGSPPAAGQPVFTGPTTIYYLPWTTGWGTSFDNRPTAIWQPAILTTDGSFGLRGGQFGFDISWASNLTVTVQVNSDLTTTNWTALQSCTLTNGTFYFSDASANSGQKYYRLSWP